MDAVLFDVDGVLIDSAPAYDPVWIAWAAERDLDAAAVARAMRGRWDEALAVLVPDRDPAAEMTRLLELLCRSEHLVRVVTGARQLLGVLPEDRRAIVTAAPRARVLERFRRLALPLPLVSVCGEDVDAHKPDPSCYRLAAARLGLAPERCIVVEDSAGGIRSGRDAGCHVIAVNCDRDDAGAADEIQPDLAHVQVRVLSLLGLR